MSRGPTTSSYLLLLVLASELSGSGLPALRSPFPVPDSGVVWKRRRMETSHGLAGALTCAWDALATLLVAALLKTQLLAQGSIRLQQAGEPGKKRDGSKRSRSEPVDAEGDDGDDNEDEDGEGEEDPSSEGGEEYADNNNLNDKSSLKKDTSGAEENGEQEKDEDGENPDDDSEDDDDDDDDGEEDEEEDEEDEEEEDEEDEEALQPPKKRKK